LHRKVKQKSTLKGADNEGDQQEKRQGEETDGETHANENGMVVDFEQEVGFFAP